MYESFYGLNTKPFQLNPDPNFYFGSKQHSRARAYLEYGMHQNEGFIVITGEVGAGKTTIVRNLLEHLDPNEVLAANLVSTQVDADDSLRLIAAAFGVRTRDLSKSDLLMALEACLLNAVQQGRRCLLIIDEAQNLAPRAVEELRMLSNFQIGNRALLQSFLVGQPEFRRILQSPNMLQLRQRVIASCHIGPLSNDETQSYIDHRLRRAGWSGGALFSSAAVEVVHRVSGGIPRRINTICDRVLLMGFISNQTDFSASDVEDVAREIVEATIGHGSESGTDGDTTFASLREELELELGKLDLGDRRAEDSASLLASLIAGQVGERILRLERSMLRLERVNFAALALLQKFVANTPAQGQQAKGDDSSAAPPEL